MHREEYKISAGGWLCVRTWRGDVYGWSAVCKLTENQLAKLRDILGMD